LSKPSLALSFRRALHPIYRRLETAVHPLRYLFLEITQQCNLNCLHCGSDCGKKARPGELGTREWIDFIDYVFRTHPNPKDLFLVFTGGEPLCHPELFRILERAKNRVLRYGLVTNGFLLDKKMVDKLADFGLDSITISLDGLKDAHDWLRRTPGSFDRALSGIRLVARAPIRIADVVTCVNPRNLKQLPELLSLIRDTNIRRWRLFNIFPKGRAASNQELLLSPGEVKEMFDWIRRARSDLATDDFLLEFACEG
jgi:MoaA/NifB/PqqE/SkfB family radical SAM enzyme